MTREELIAEAEAAGVSSERLADIQKEAAQFAQRFQAAAKPLIAKVEAAREALALHEETLVALERRASALERRLSALEPQA
jgi:hypothetical protein